MNAAQIEALRDKVDELPGDQIPYATLEALWDIALQLRISNANALGCEDRGSVVRTGRGFQIIEFTDMYGATCSLQQSSLSSAVWLGVDINSKGGKVSDGKMHLNLYQAKSLVAVLQLWIESGSLESEVKA